MRFVTIRGEEICNMSKNFLIGIGHEILLPAEHGSRWFVVEEILHRFSKTRDNLYKDNIEVIVRETSRAVCR